jgi:hypothetical protein
MSPGEVRGSITRVITGYRSRIALSHYEYTVIIVASILLVTTMPTLVEVTIDAADAAATTSFQVSNFGDAVSTTGVRVAGLASFDKHQKEHDDPLFADITPLYVENDNMEILLSSFASWYKETKIPHANNNSKFLEADTKAKYWGNVKEAFKKKFPSHEAWEDDDWCTRIREGIKKEARRTEFHEGTDSQDDKVRALYLKVEAAYVRFKYRANSNWDSMEGRDLVSILENMMKSANRNNRVYEKRCIILCTYFGVGRGG